MSDNGNTLLHTAILRYYNSQYSLTNVKIVLEHDASDINVRNSNGKTPLHLAVQKVKDCRTGRVASKTRSGCYSYDTTRR